MRRQYPHRINTTSTILAVHHVYDVIKNAWPPTTVGSVSKNLIGAANPLLDYHSYTMTSFTACLLYCVKQINISRLWSLRAYIQWHLYSVQSPPSPVLNYEKCSLSSISDKHTGHWTSVISDRVTMPMCPIYIGGGMEGGRGEQTSNGSWNAKWSLVFC